MADEKLVFMVLHGPDEPEHATIPFVMACAALASDVEVVIGLQADGVELGRCGGVDGVEAFGFPPLQKRSSTTSARSAAECSFAARASSHAGSRPTSSSTARKSWPPVGSSPRSPRRPTASSTEQEEPIMTATLIDLETVTAARVVDARGAACPGPLLEAKKGMGTVPVGSVIEVWSTDPVTKTDIAAWSGKVGHEFLGALSADGYDRVLIRRGK
jgi:TusA-related sulfurtransferase